MGAGSWSVSDWSTYSTATKAKPPHEIFTSRGMHADMDPKGVTVRESRDSAEHPDSNAIIIALDETGSMGRIPEIMVKEKLGTLVSEILDRKPVNDPQIMFMGVGDSECDKAPLQIGQFESDLTMTSWLEKLYLEGGGGGNDGESYTLTWYFAALHTSLDCFEKRGRKGYLFTIGDEPFLNRISRHDIAKFVGDTPQADLTAEDLLTMVKRTYHVYHIMIAQGNGYRHGVKERWQHLLGQNAIELTDYNKLSEVIVSAIQINEGATVDSVVKSWSGDTSMVVARAVTGLTSTTASAGVTRF